MKKNLQVLSVLLAVAILSSCSSENKTDKQPPAQVTADTITVEKAAELVLESMPKPGDIPATLDRVDAKFNSSLVNKPGKSSSYSAGTLKAAANLGIYSVDMGYMAIYKKTAEALKYAKDIQQLSEEVNIQDVFNADMVKRIENNLDNPDSLRAINDEGIAKANFLMAKNGNTKEAILVGTGIFVEGLYIASQLVATYPKDLPEETRTLVITPLIHQIVDQEAALGYLNTVLKSINNDKEVADITAKMDDLAKAYKQLNVKERLKTEKSGTVVTDQNLVNVTTKIKELREYLVK